MAKKKPSQDSTISRITQAFKSAESNVKKETGLSFFSLSEYEKAWGIPGYLPFGLPDLDFLCMHDKERTQFGIPRGRITEIHGESSSFKSTLCYRLAAETLLRGGRVYWLSTEVDFSTEYALEHVREYGVDQSFAEENFKGRPVKHLADLFKTFRAIMKPLSEISAEMGDEGLNPIDHFPPILFVVDSISAVLSGTDWERMDKKEFEDGMQQGAHAGELHRLFKYIMYSLAEIGAAVVLTNHYRADMSYSRKNKKPAHEGIVKYYSSLRISVNAYRWSPLASKTNPSSGGLEYDWGRQMIAKVYKVRGKWKLAGEAEIYYQFGHGFHYPQSVFQVLRATGVVTVSGRKLVIDVEDDDLLTPLNGTYNTAKDVKELLLKRADLMPDIAAAAMMRGPVRVKDGRK